MDTRTFLLSYEVRLIFPFSSISQEIPGNRLMDLDEKRSIYVSGDYQ